MTSPNSLGLQITINGIIELHRRIARGFRNPDNYRLRMILAAGRLTHPNLR
jgi:transposase